MGCHEHTRACVWCFIGFCPLVESVSRFSIDIDEAFKHAFLQDTSSLLAYFSDEFPFEESELRGILPPNESVWKKIEWSAIDSNKQRKNCIKVQSQRIVEIPMNGCIHQQMKNNEKYSLKIGKSPSLISVVGCQPIVHSYLFCIFDSILLWCCFGHWVLA